MTDAEILDTFGPDSLHWADNTKAARSDDWAAWLKLHLVDLDGDAAITAVEAWMMAGHKWSTIERRLSSLRVHFWNARGAWLFDPYQRAALRRLRKRAAIDGLRTRDPAPPLLAEDLADALRWASTRDRALVLVGWHGALRASEIAALHWGDVTFEKKGVGLELRDTKTGLNQSVFLPLLPVARRHVCAVAALRQLPVGSPRSSVFGFYARPLSRQAVSAIVARVCRAGGLGDGFSGHSLRAGYATSCALAGIPDTIIARQTRHRSMSTLALYVRPASLRRAPPALEVFR